MRTCTLLFLTKKGQILLAMKKRGFGKGRWNGVGGKLNKGETVEQAMVRECQEEIGVTPSNYWQVAEHDFLEYHEGDPAHMYVYAYFCDKWQGEPTETEEMAPRWFDITDVPYDDMWPDDLIWLPQVLRGKQLKSKFEFDRADDIKSVNLEIVKGF